MAIVPMAYSLLGFFMAMKQVIMSSAMNTTAAKAVVDFRIN